MASDIDRADVALFARLRDERERRERGSRQLWTMTPAQREAAMWRRELTFAQLHEWTARAPRDVPLIDREFAWISSPSGLTPAGPARELSPNG